MWFKIVFHTDIHCLLVISYHENWERGVTNSILFYNYTDIDTDNWKVPPFVGGTRYSGSENRDNTVVQQRGLQPLAATKSLVNHHGHVTVWTFEHATGPLIFFWLIFGSLIRLSSMILLFVPASVAPVQVITFCPNINTLTSSYEICFARLISNKVHKLLWFGISV